MSEFNTKGSGIVRYPGRNPRGGKTGMKNKRKKKVAKERFEERMAKMRKERDEEARVDEWTGEWNEFGDD